MLAAAPAPADTIRHYNIEEAVVVASPKETAHLRRQPLSVSFVNSSQLERREIHSAKDISAYAPNFFMPAYGSRITSACYIRGIGSRINTPAVGLYVDNVPYIDKSAYDFHFEGIDRVDVLRGPQGTLYGRNTMGGLLRIFTADPITHSGTEVSAGFTTRTAGRRAAFTTYLHPADRMGLSVSGYYEGENGFYTNQATGKKQDGSEAAGGRLRWSWQPTDVVKLDWTASYEYSDEDACPYFYLPTTPTTDPTTGATTTVPSVISQNRPSNYRRHLLNTGLGVEHKLDRMVLTSITAWQRLDDRLFMDQDFTARDVFTLEQKQYMNTFSEEIALRSKDASRRWQWTTGVFAMYQHLRTTCPVTFYADGVSMINRQLAAVLPESPKMSLAFTGETLPFSARLMTPSANAALFHQSTVQRLGLKGLSLTVGLRLDYDHRELKLHSGQGVSMPYHFEMAMGPMMQLQKDLEADAALDGKLKNDTWQLLPKVALNYALPRSKGHVYASVTKGYRSGGYNIQAYSDLSQTALRRSVMTGVKDFSKATIEALPLPDAVKDKALQGMTAALDQHMPAAPDVHTLYYKPETTWSYELGTHLNLADKRLWADVALFYMHTRNQQLARFAESGMGRVMVNAGRSRSLGVEVEMHGTWCDGRLLSDVAYGFTDARFTNYNLGEQTTATGDKVVVDYTDNRVPFAPAHTFSASLDYRHPLRKGGVKALSIGADVKGAGDVMWNEANTFSQPIYATLNARCGMELKGNVKLSVWASNLTATRYATFSFESMGNRFAQYGQPRCFGADVRWKF